MSANQGLKINTDAAGLRHYRWTGPTGSDFHQIRQPSGTWYHASTPPAVIAILERAISIGSRLRLWFGDTETGKASDQKYDVVGFIGRGASQISLPLLLPSIDSHGGVPISDHQIVAIARGPGNVFAYEHPTLDLGIWTRIAAIDPASTNDYIEAVLVDGKIHSHHKSPVQADHMIEFMTGLRWAK